MSDETAVAILQMHTITVQAKSDRTEGRCSCGEWSSTDHRRRGDIGGARLRIMRSFHKHCIRVIEEQEV